MTDLPENAGWLADRTHAGEEGAAALVILSFLNDDRAWQHVLAPPSCSTG
ncbi:MAG: hypothetical protein ACRCZP_11580 [Phycicoccus sp.]